MAKIVYANRDALISLLVILACLLLLKYFPTTSLFEKLTVLVAFMIVLPILFIKLIARKKLADFGIRAGNWKRGLAGMALGLSLSFFVLYFLVNYTSFMDYYQIMKAFRGHFREFVIYELGYVAVLILVLEFFFRGFALFSLAERLGRWSVLVQFLLLVLFFAFSQNLDWDKTFYILTAPFAGYIALSSRSLLYSYFYSWIFIVLADTILIRIIK